MHGHIKIWLIAALLVILAGCILFAAGMSGLVWDFENLSTEQFETNAHTVHEDFQYISVTAGTADISVLPSMDKQVSVVCYESTTEKHAVFVENKTLTVQLEDHSHWYEHIGIAFDSPKITIYLPQEVYGALSVTVSTGSITVTEDFQFDVLDLTATTGDIRAEGLTAGKIEVSASTGQVFLRNITCKTLRSRGNTGDMALENVTAAETIHITRSTGSILFDRCDAPDITAVTDTGDITGSLRSGKVFHTSADTGKVDVPKDAPGGTCEVSTDTGDISLRISP